eukprot:TRINITY_DN116_c0_g3_i2.p2 TRINITY_DN116_c0_g3~~TRINITY_DN116_c0_g3_i2.p2  ORF type:complete len:149 (+),score=32.07 TRINITY_DN116_c0_g3_i2:479-925(+)
MDHFEKLYLEEKLKIDISPDDRKELAKKTAGEMKNIELSVVTDALSRVLKRHKDRIDKVVAYMIGKLGNDLTQTDDQLLNKYVKSGSRVKKFEFEYASNKYLSKSKTARDNSQKEKDKNEQSEAGVPPPKERTLEDILNSQSQSQDSQ